VKQIAIGYLKCFLPAAQRWWKHKHSNDAASLAFYSLISLVPILITSVWVTSLVIDESVVRRIVITETERVAGDSISTYIAKILSPDARSSHSNFSPIIAAAFTFFAATKMLIELRNSFDKVFGKPTTKAKFFHSAISRFISFSVIIGFGFIIVSSLLIETLMKLLLNALEDKTWLQYIYSCLTPLVTFTGVVLLTAYIMQVLPNKKPKIKPALIGAVLFATMLLGLKYLVFLIIKHSEMSSYNGSAATLVLVLFWVYFTMQALLYCAEYTAELNHKSEPS